MNSGITQSQAAIIREFISHPGMKLLVDAIQGKAKAGEHAWLNATDPVEAEKIRQSSRCYGVLMGTLNQFLLKAKVDETNGSKSE